MSLVPRFRPSPTSEERFRFYAHISWSFDEVLQTESVHSEEQALSLLENLLESTLCESVTVESWQWR